MIAALPMYDAPGQQAANDRLWALIRDALPFAAPTVLTRGRDLWDVWQDPNLLFAQTCGLPYRARLHDQVTLIGAPDHRIAGVIAGEYRSVIVVRNDELVTSLDGLRLAVNDPLSQSGWAVVADTSAVPTLLTGSHAASAKAVIDRRADVAALDASTWRHLVAVDPAMGALSVLRHSAPGPSLPFVTRQAELREPLFEAVQSAFAGLDTDDAHALGMYGIVPVQPDDYLRLPIPQAPVLT